MKLFSSSYMSAKLTVKYHVTTNRIIIFSVSLYILKNKMFFTGHLYKKMYFRFFASVRYYAFRGAYN